MNLGVIGAVDEVKTRQFSGESGQRAGAYVADVIAGDMEIRHAGGVVVRICFCSGIGQKYVISVIEQSHGGAAAGKGRPFPPMEHVPGAV